MPHIKSFLILLFCLIMCTEVGTYPIDGYEFTGINRLKRLQLILEGEIKDTPPIPGALKSIHDIELHLLGQEGDSLRYIPNPDPELQKAVNGLFPNMHESYSLALMDITPGNEFRFAQRQGQRNFQPGSVGKIAIAAGLFCELENLYPDSFEKRRELLKNKRVKAGRWAISNEHTVPFFDPETKKFFKRPVQTEDVFSLYEWTDHMLSVSSNAAASIMWREVILMRAFGPEYPELTEERASEYFKVTPKSELTAIGMTVVNEPLREVDIAAEEWRLGSLFTREAKAMVPGSGGSTASPVGLMKFLLAIENGKFVDAESSLEIKRLLYMTDRRIRYAASPALKEAAVYFKSGSLYKCKPEPGYECKKYMGNADNYMNSIAIVEHPGGPVYLVALMSNVPKKNSASDHMYLATKIDNIVKRKYAQGG